MDRALLHLTQSSLNTSLVRVAEISRQAIQENVPALIVEAGNLLDMEMPDHHVIGRNSNVSLKERGLGF